MSKRRGFGDGALDERAPGVWRLRYRIEGRRFSVTIRGSRVEAQRELRRRLKAGDDGTHVAPGRLTLAQWVTEWLALVGAKRRGRTLERYRQLLSRHIAPVLGARPLQQIETREISRLYLELDSKLAARTKRRIISCSRAFSQLLSVRN